MAKKIKIIILVVLLLLLIGPIVWVTYYYVPRKISSFLPDEDIVKVYYQDLNLDDDAKWEVYNGASSVDKEVSEEYLDEVNDFIENYRYRIEWRGLKIADDRRILIYYEDCYCSISKHYLNKYSLEHEFLEGYQIAGLDFPDWFNK